MEDFESQKENMESLKKQLVNNRRFLHMVIHDMRNPTNSIQFGLEQSISNYQKHKI